MSIRRALLAAGVLAIVASAAALFPRAGSSREGDPKLTYTITRDDLIVTVTIAGLLESAENNEIKCKVRGQSTVTWVAEGGTEVKPGDELVKLDTLFIENAVNERSKYAHWSRSAAERSRADLVRAELAIPEYLEGRYRAQVMTREKDLAVARSNLRTAQNMLSHAEMLFKRGYVSQLDIDESTFAVTQAALNVDVKKTHLDILKRFDRAMQLETLQGSLKSTKARHAANMERAQMDATRRDIALEELKLCVITAEKSGLVIHPSAAAWMTGPEIEVGSTVHKDQVLLLMPDLSQMQVKVGIHEAHIDRVKPGLTARVTLPDRTLDGEVDSVASVTRPAGWWNGNAVKYDTIIKLPSVPGLSPGMSADVEILVDRHENELTIPVAAVVETEQGTFCWVKTTAGARRRPLRLGDTNDVFTVVTSGLKAGDKVILNPLALEQAAEAKQPQTKPKTT